MIASSCKQTNGNETTTVEKVKVTLAYVGILSENFLKLTLF